MDSSRNHECIWCLTRIYFGEHLFIFSFFSTGSRLRATTTAARPSGPSSVKKSKTGQYFTLARGRCVFPMYASWHFYSNWMIVWEEVVYSTDNRIKIGNFEALFPLSLTWQLVVSNNTVKNQAVSAHIANRGTSADVCWQCSYICDRAGKISPIYKLTKETVGTAVLLEELFITVEPVITLQ